MEERGRWCNLRLSEVEERLRQHTTVSSELCLLRQLSYVCYVSSELRLLHQSGDILSGVWQSVSFHAAAGGVEEGGVGREGG